MQRTFEAPEQGASRWTAKHTSPIGFPRSPRRKRQCRQRVSALFHHELIPLRHVNAHAPTGQNPKAFTFSNPGKLAKQAARSHDVGSRLPVVSLTTYPDHSLLRSKRSASMCPSSTAFPMNRPRASSRLSALRAWARQHYCGIPPKSMRRGHVIANIHRTANP